MATKCGHPVFGQVPQEPGCHRYCRSNESYNQEDRNYRLYVRSAARRSSGIFTTTTRTVKRTVQMSMMARPGALMTKRETTWPSLGYPSGQPRIQPRPRPDRLCSQEVGCCNHLAFPGRHWERTEDPTTILKGPCTACYAPSFLFLRLRITGIQCTVCLGLLRKIKELTPCGVYAVDDYRRVDVTSAARRSCGSPTIMTMTLKRTGAVMIGRTPRIMMITAKGSREKF
jgi:hypothetical protein